MNKEDNEIIEEENIQEEKDTSVKNDFVNNSTNSEKNSDIKYLIFIILFIIILLGVGIYGLMMLNSKENNIDGSFNNNVDVTPNEDDEINNDIVFSEDEGDGRVINIYQKGYADKGPIAFTYKCKSDICDLKVIDKGFILYDEEIIQYREMSDFEYKQINNSEESPKGGKLNLDGFEEVESLVKENDNTIIKVYVINNEIYIIDNKDNVILSYDEYRNKKYNNVTKIDNLVLFDGFIFDYVNNEKLYYQSETKFDISSYGKFGKLYYFNTDSLSSYILFDVSTKDIDFVDKTMTYVNDNKLYYIDNTENTQVVYHINSDGKKSVISEDGTKPFFLYEGKLFYLDSDNILIVKNLLNNSVYKSDVVIKNKHYMLNYDKNGFEILEVDHTILKNEDFDLFRKNLGVKDKDFNLCLIDLSECPVHGNLIKLDKDGKFLSKEFYYKVSTPSE